MRPDVLSCFPEIIASFRHIGCFIYGDPLEVAKALIIIELLSKQLLISRSKASVWGG